MRVAATSCGNTNDDDDEEEEEEEEDGTEDAESDDQVSSTLLFSSLSPSVDDQNRRSIMASDQMDGSVSMTAPAVDEERMSINAVIAADATSRLEPTGPKVLRGRGSDSHCWNEALLDVCEEAGGTAVCTESEE
jgi:hypothetical protein